MGVVERHRELCLADRVTVVRLSGVREDEAAALARGLRVRARDAMADRMGWGSRQGGRRRRVMRI